MFRDLMNRILKRSPFSSLKKLSKSMATSRKETSKSYKDAVECLNTLQSNASVLEKAKAERQKNRHRNLTETIEFADRIGITLEKLDDLSIIHVSGTKGKGSTCAFCESILRAHGYKTGFYSSPHLIEVRERIRINGCPLSKDDFSDYFWKTYTALDLSKQNNGESMPSYFKFLTLMAFNVFLEEQVDVAIIEVGLGGQYDCTNIIKSPVVCGVSSLGMDHTSILGDTLDKIAWNKAGIFKPGVPAVTVPQPEDSIQVIIERAQEIGAPLSLIPKLEDYGWGSTEIQLGIHGYMQYMNASLALQLCNIWLQDHNKRVSERKIEYQGKLSDSLSLESGPSFSLSLSMIEGLRNCRWPGRAHTVKKQGITYFLDGAHTPRSLRQCVAWYKEACQAERKDIRGAISKVLLFNSTGERKAHTLLEEIIGLEFDCALFCPNISSLGGNSLDQTNLMVTTESQLFRCTQNMNAWLELSSLKHKESNQRESPVKSMDDDADNIITDSGRTVTANNTDTGFKKPAFTFCSIQEALTFIAHGRKTDFPLAENYTCADLPACVRDAEHIQILITGSLHLVGGTLRLIDPELNNRA